MVADVILDDGDFRLEAAGFCAVPGYLVVRLQGEVRSLGDLTPELAERLGMLLSRTASALETIAGADRVYCLSFCEVDRQLHFHLFPRTDWLLAAYRDAAGDVAEEVNGPALFEWARGALVRPEDLPQAAPDRDEVLAGVRGLLMRR